ncbi:MAG: heterodisulfide reductase [Proteobacteria bacterium]|nr:MAG: heterodisulfide reductase [Pseudomonadota bacterium]PIE65209.1 MAG: heterodisulfide reductase [Desulfobacterales bacterium]
MDKCIGCGECAARCPKKVIDTFNGGLAKRKAIYVEYAQAVPLKYAIDPDHCIYLTKGKCGMCKKVCPADAVDFGQQKETVRLNVGSVIIASGLSPYEPSDLDMYQYAQHTNVITSIEMERILSATGPFQGHLLRPSDKKPPTKIAWLQCVGSRDINRCGNSYCSSVCCMYAIKEAVIAREHAEHELDTAIFYMDMRTYGKEFETYYERAKREQGVRFVRTRIHSITGDQESGDLQLRYIDEKNKIVSETFDMVVLSVGFQTSGDLMKLAETFDIELNNDHFARTTSFRPVTTSRDGIYVCGSFQEPKDIPYAVMEASAAACRAQSDLAAARGLLTRTRTYPVETRLDETVRIGVFVCNCGANIGSIVDVPAVARMAETLADVVYVEENLFTCSQDSQEKISAVIKREKLNRIVVAACTPRTHEELFQETLKDAGLNKYLFEMANIRNQCSWVHSREKEAATAKAMDLVRMAVARSRQIKSLDQPTIGVDSSALVIGGGIAGMTAALGLADQGFKVHLVEKETKLGGVARDLIATWQGEDIAANLAELRNRVEDQPLIDIHISTTVKEGTGFIGNFKTILSSNTGETEIVHGAIVIATGAEEYQPGEYLYGKDDRIMTHLEMDRAVKAGDKRFSDAESVVFIQCVGSREPERRYCSKVCCTHSIKSAIRFKDNNPQTGVFILYRDIRTYGRRESLYREAREKGVIFIRYDCDTKPLVTNKDGQLRVTVRDHILDVDVDIRADLLILASAIVPRNNDGLARIFKLSTSSDGFLNEAHAKLRPVECATAGVFLAGMVHYPKPIEEAITQAAAAASRAAVTLSRETITVDGVVSTVQQFMCRGCGECEKACPFNAISVITDGEGRGMACVQEALCKGCGMCAVACPTGAATIRNYQDRDIVNMVETAFT